MRAVYRSYGRYYGESFRLPSVDPIELDDRFTYEGSTTSRGPQGRVRADAVPPHLGSWEWTALWLTRVRGIPLTAVVERIEPPALFDWFVDFRESIGMHIVRWSTPGARSWPRSAGPTSSPCCATGTSRHRGGDTFFGERTTLPSGPVVMALRTGAPILPTRCTTGAGATTGVSLPPVLV